MTCIYTYKGKTYTRETFRAMIRNESPAELSKVFTDLSPTPDFPFSKTWHELAAKKILDYAARNGYDEVAWTPGEEQGKRYSEDNGGPKDQARTAGMKGFYDKILPDTFNKIGKRFGSKVGETPVVTSNDGRMIDDGAGGLVREGGKPVETPLHSLPITAEMRKSLTTEGQPLFEHSQGTNKGSVNFRADGKAIIRALDNPDASTVPHELSHVFRRSLFRDQLLPKEDLDYIEKWAGVKDGDWTPVDADGNLNPVHEEKWSRAFERYLSEGKADWAPEPLQRAFALFKRWMADIYHGIKGSAIDVELTPQIREIFAKVLGKGLDEPAVKAPTEPPTASKYIADSLNPKTMRLSPEVQANIVAQAKEMGIDKRVTASTEETLKLARSLNLSPADLKDWQPGAIPHAPEGIAPKIWRGAWEMAVTNLHTGVQEKYSGAQADTLDAKEDYLDTPTPATKLAHARAVKAENAAKSVAMNMLLHDKTLRETAGQGLQILKNAPDPSVGTGYKDSVLKAPSLAEAMGKKPVVKNGARPAKANSVSDPDLQNAIDAYKAGKKAGPTLNQAASDKTETPSFKRYFEGSKVVDAQGKPKPVYHSGWFDEEDNPVPDIGKEGFHFGTEAAAQERNAGKTVDDFLRALSITEDPDTGQYHWSSDGVDSYDLDEEGFGSESEARQDAEEYAQNMGDYGDNEDMPVTKAYLSIKNPMRVKDQAGDWTKAVQEAKAKGHDGIVYTNEFEDKGKDSYIALNPEQIKSVHNRGTFDPNDANILHQADEDPLTTIARYHYDAGKTTLPNWRAAVEKSIGEPLKLTEARDLYDKTVDAVKNDVKEQQIEAVAPLLKDQLAGDLGRKGVEQFLRDLSDTTRDKIAGGEQIGAFTSAERDEIAKTWDLSTPERLKTSSKASNNVVRQIVHEAKAGKATTFEDLIGPRVQGGKLQAKVIKGDLMKDGTGRDAIDALMNAPESLTKAQSQRLARAIDKVKKVNKPSDPNAVTLRLTRLMKDARSGKLDLTTGKAETLKHFRDKYTQEVMAKTGLKDKGAQAVTDAVAEKMKPIETALDKVADDDFPAQAEIVNTYDKAGLEKWAHNLAAYYRANLLSNPASLVAIMASHVASNIVERFVIDPIASLPDANYVKKNGGQRAIATNVKDIGSAAKSIPQGFKTAGAVMRGGESAVHLGRAQDYSLPSGQIRSDFEIGLGKIANQVKDPRLAAAIRTTGHIMNLPVRFFTRQHGAAFSVPGVPIYEQALRDAARTKAVSDGLKGKEQDAAAQRYYDTRPEDMQKMADENFYEKMFVNRNRFNDFLNQLGEHGPVSRLIKTLLAPFAKIPSNIAGRAIEWTPVGLFKGLDMMRNTEKMKDPIYRANAYRAFTRGAVGSTSMLIAYEYAQSHEEKDGHKPLMQGVNVAEHRYAPILNFPNGKSVGLGKMAPFINPVSAGLTLGDRKASGSDFLQAIAGESPYTGISTTTDNLFPDATESTKLNNNSGATATDTLAQKFVKYSKGAGNKAGAQITKGFIPASALLNAVAAEGDRSNGMRQKQTFGDQIAGIMPGPPAKFRGQALTRQALPILRDSVNRPVPEGGGLSAFPVTTNPPTSPLQQRQLELQDLREQVQAAIQKQIAPDDVKAVTLRHMLNRKIKVINGNLADLKLRKNPGAYQITPYQMRELNRPPSAYQDKARLDNMDAIIKSTRDLLGSRK